MDQFIRYGVLIAVGGSLLLLEMFFDAKERQEPREWHISRNLVFGLLGTIIVGLFYTSTLLFAEGFATHYEIGGLMAYSLLHPVVNAIILFILFDLVLYFWHMANHRLPVLWRFHKVHHSDADLDFSSAVRFHVGELLISILVKAMFLIATGSSILLIAFFDMLVTLFALYNHANLSMGRAESVLRTFLVTPDMHRIHHSQHREETDSNYTTMLSLWDRIFGTYTHKTKHQDGVGLKQFKSKKSRGILAMFLMPFGK